MKTLKAADLLMQVLLVVAGTINAVVPNPLVPIIYAYFVVGAWQLTSLFIHLIAQPWWMNLRARGYYLKAIAWAVLVGLICLLFLSTVPELMLLYLSGSLIFSALLAIWYIRIGWDEWKCMLHRSFIHLK